MEAPTHARRPALAMALLMAFPLALLAAPAGADEAVLLEARLPVQLCCMGLAWDGTHAWLLGGVMWGYEDLVLRYTPATGAVVDTGARLPTARGDGAAVWDGTHAYLFGGQGAGAGTQVLRFDPATHGLQVMGAALPTPRSQMAAVWDGAHAWLFGGQDGAPLRDILRYDPATDTLVAVEAKLPSARRGASAVWDGAHAWVFGGRGPGGNLAEVVRFDPASGEVVVAGQLPGHAAFAAAAWDGEAAYVFRQQMDIVRWRPETGEATVMAARLPAGGYRPAALFDGGAFHLLGGDSPAIVRYRLIPGPPLGLAAAPGAGLAEIALSWEPPAPNTYSSPITGYRVFRATGGGPFALLAELGPETSFVDRWLPDTSWAPRESYRYHVTAVNRVGEGPPSAHAACSPLASLPPVLGRCELPAAPVPLPLPPA